MDAMPRVSVLVTAYNNPMIFEALKSIKDQTFKDYEVILLDDNTNPDLEMPEPKPVTREDWIGYRYYKSNVQDADRWKSPRYADQINVGLKLAEGDIIAYLTDDDLWKPNKLERIVQVYDADPEIAAVLGQQQMTRRESDGSWTDLGVRNYGMLTPTGDPGLWQLFGDPYYRVDHSSVTHLRACYLNVGPWPTGNDPINLRAADALYWRKLYQAGYPFYVVQEVLDTHRYHPNALTARIDRGEHLASI